jgi:vitamin B12/bleomycin/antimicrobial peptide transport system ATP-binding/permease protein
MFMPVRAYIPPGSLRSAIAYPHPTEDYDAPAIVNALAAVGLEHLEPHLEKEDRWDRELTDNEKQCVAFARVILQRPGWVVVNDALDVLDPDSRTRIKKLFEGEYADVGLINIGHDQPDNSLYGRKFRIVVDALGVTFRPENEHGIPEPPKSAAESVSAE